MRDELGRFIKGHKAINPFLKGNGLRLGIKMTTEQKEKISKSNKGRKLSEEHREKLRRAKIGYIPWIKGKNHTLETKKRLSKQRKGISTWWTKGDKNNNWKGGITPTIKKLRQSIEYKLWREAVFKRDNWTCQFCGKIGGQLNADHIKMFAYHPELRFAIDNGRTLCRECHKELWTTKSKKHTCCN
jgi:5-methylcytosine-specific restriction endonuclease McrA